METDRDRIFGKLPEGVLMYCINCERTYEYGKHRILLDLDHDGETLELCPYEGCEGDAVIDAKEWDVIREWHPDYPETPEHGVVYPLN